MGALSFRDGNLYVAIETGQPEHQVKIGIGETREDALKALEDVPIQSTGLDSGLAAAISWAKNAGWFTGDLEALE